MLFCFLENPPRASVKIPTALPYNLFLISSSVKAFNAGAFLDIKLKPSMTIPLLMFAAYA